MNLVLLEHSHIHSFTYYLRLLLPSNGRSSSYKSIAHHVQNIYLPALCRKSLLTPTLPYLLVIILFDLFSEFGGINLSHLGSLYSFDFCDFTLSWFSSYPAANFTSASCSPLSLNVNVLPCSFLSSHSVRSPWVPSYAFHFHLY